MASRPADEEPGGERVSALRRGVSALYGLGARIHRAFMRRTAPSRGGVACAVVSVGGITVGGAGKTPVAARTARALASRGYRVVIASRGYRGRTRDRVTVVSDGERVYSQVEQTGDESLVLAAHAPGVPVLVGRDRRVVAHHAVSVWGAEILVLDDGFQHHKLARDLDLVCLDGGEGLGNGRVVPAGPLREPIDALAGADAVCLVDVATGWSVRKLGLPEPLSARVLWARRQPVELTLLDRSESRPLAWLEGRKLGALSGIGRPGALTRTLRTLGAVVESEQRFPDHHAYRASDFRTLAEGGGVWVTTEKDALKILPAWVGAAEVWVLSIEAEFEDEPGVLDWIEAHLASRGKLPGRSAVAAGISGEPS